jgi:adenylosuccinate synthase
VKTFVDQNEREIGIPFTLLSTGPDISEIVDLREEKLRRT